MCRFKRNHGGRRGSSGAREDLQLPEERSRIIDLSQSLWRMSLPPPGRSNVVTPNGRLFDTKRCRLLTGLEKMALQGIFYKSAACRNWPPSLLGDLAGNAFQTNCCMSVVIVALLSVSTLSAASSRGGDIERPLASEGSAATIHAERILWGSSGCDSDDDSV